MPRFLVSAAHKSSGKTTVSLGLCAALLKKGYSVQPFKKGPDYIDPLWLSMASGRNCYNLDFYTQSHDEILQTYFKPVKKDDICIIEGNKGLYDGTDIEGSNSSAALAKLLRAPVVLVINTKGITRSIAPLLLGFQAFDTDVNIAGIILNNVGGARHEQKLRAVVERYTRIPVIGAIQRDSRLQITERHLGLIPSNETSEARQKIDAIADLIESQVDLDRLLEIANQADVLQKPDSVAITVKTVDVVIGIARDAAFGFYYPDDIEALTNAGASLIEFDTLSDTCLPTMDGLFIGGGFPETQMAQLHANHGLRKDIKNAIENGLPTYAECGGLMYLSNSITWNSNTHDMVGIIPGNITMHDRPVGRGYTVLEETADAPWKQPAMPSKTINAHEFHYSSLDNLSGNHHYAYKVKRGTGITDGYDGIVYKNLLATYSHQRHSAKNLWAQQFVEFIRRTKLNNRSLGQQA